MPRDYAYTSSTSHEGPLLVSNLGFKKQCEALTRTSKALAPEGSRAGVKKEGSVLRVRASLWTDQAYAYVGPSSLPNRHRVLGNLSSPR